MPTDADSRRSVALTPREAASVLGISVTTIYRAIEAGQLQAVRLGGRGSSLRITPTALAEFMHPTVLAAPGVTRRQAGGEASPGTSPPADRDQS